MMAQHEAEAGGWLIAMMLMLAWKMEPTSRSLW